MAKVFQTIFEIAGRLDGSLFGAIRTATGALKGLKGLTTTLNPPQKSLSPLLAQLKQLQGVQRQMTRYQQLNAGLGARQVEYYRSQEMKELERRKVGRESKSAWCEEVSALKAEWLTTKDFVSAQEALGAKIAA